MKGNIWLIGIFVIGIVIVLYLFYQFSQEKTVIEADIPNIPSYVDVEFFVGSESEKKLPTPYLDLSKEYYEFPMTIKNSFEERVSATVCPTLMMEFPDSTTSSIDVDCLAFELEPGNFEQRNIKIPLSEKDKIGDSIKIYIKITLTYSGMINSLCDLYLTSGYPYCKIAKTSSLEISPLMQPNPMDLEKDTEFSTYLKIEKFSEMLKIDKVEIIPIETKIKTTFRNTETIEAISLEESYSGEISYEVSQPADYIFIHKFSAPKIKVEEKENKEYYPIDCESEGAKKLKICELKFTEENVKEIFKKLPLEVKVYFTATKSLKYQLYVK